METVHCVIFCDTTVSLKGVYQLEGRVQYFGPKGENIIFVATLTSVEGLVHTATVPFHRH